ncbi:hypothetical protein ZEAMMB73_Zm00001d046678 [Zea mays]|uniref:Uncharacterized protein n=1 Tax=Zea mays TaxID=4577 RepID=K7VFF1_MAIZE|nr:hypothetical protein ZEAMMB73_Zm00001d046678 [Zea mays]
MVVSTTEEQVHRGFVVVKRSPVKMEGVMRVITSGNDCFVNVVGMSISLEKKVAIPLVCLGDSRPVVDLFYSSVTPDGYFLISASKGCIQGYSIGSVKVDDTEVISFLLQTEIIPLCLRTMEMGSELSKTEFGDQGEDSIILSSRLKEISTLDRPATLCFLDS